MNDVFQYFYLMLYCFYNKTLNAIIIWENVIMLLKCNL